MSSLALLLMCNEYDEYKMSSIASGGVQGFVFMEDVEQKNIKALLEHTPIKIHMGIDTFLELEGYLNYRELYLGFSDADTIDLDFIHPSDSEKFTVVDQDTPLQWHMYFEGWKAHVKPTALKKNIPSKWLTSQNVYIERRFGTIL